MPKNIEKINWEQQAVKFLIGEHPKALYPHEQIFIEAVRIDNGYKWVCRWSNSVLTYNGKFLIEKDFRGEERNQILFQTKEDALTSYYKWKDNYEKNQ